MSLGGEPLLGYRQASPDEDRCLFLNLPPPQMSMGHHQGPVNHRVIFHIPNKVSHLLMDLRGRHNPAEQASLPW